MHFYSLHMFHFIYLMHNLLNAYKHHSYFIYLAFNIYLYTIYPFHHYTKQSLGMEQLIRELHIFLNQIYIHRLNMDYLYILIQLLIHLNQFIIKNQIILFHDLMHLQEVLI